MTHEPEKEELFYHFGRRMKEEMKQNGQLYRRCVFNDIHFTISSDSNIDDIAIIWDLKMKLNNYGKRN